FDAFCRSAGPLPAVDHPGPTANSDIIYTSGTTGPPKGVMLTHDMLLRTAFGSTYGRAFEDARRILFSLPMYHVYGYVEGLLAALFVGGAIIPQLKFDAADTLGGIERHRATDVLLIPTMTLALLDAVQAKAYDLSSLHSMLSSGGRSPAYIWQQIFDRLRPVELTTGYGMTEVTASSTVTRPDDPMERLLATNGRLRDVGPAADPDLDGRLVVYRVVDPETGAVLPPDETGELQARGIGVTAGYYNKPAETAAAFTADGWLHTGDLGRLDRDGYILLVGRLKESYRCGGEQVLPSEIEDLLVTHPSVLQAHVVPLPDERMGEIGVACVVLRPEPATTPQELIAFCATRLARFKVPRHVLPIRVEEIPTTPSGRARKFLLAEIVRDRLATP
ncbi:MAG: class I adenylate-forming enzyme family protein, partial [Alsobacter sp.]